MERALTNEPDEPGHAPDPPPAEPMTGWAARPVPKDPMKGIVRATIVVLVILIAVLVFAVAQQMS